MPISQAILLCTCSLERESSFRPLKNTNIEKMKNIIDKTKKYLKSFYILLVLNKHKLSFLIPAFNSLFGYVGNNEKKIAETIEAMRTEMAAREGNIVYFASPKPGSYSPENQDKPVHGRVKEFSYRKAAFNGVNKQWGLFLHNLVKNKPSNNIIEMGTCSGFSGCYIRSLQNKN